MSGDKTFWQFVASILSHPSTVEILIRCLCVAGAAVGARMTYRWYLHSFTRMRNETIQKKSRNSTIFFNIVLSFIIAATYYMEDYIPTGKIIWQNGDKVPELVLQVLQWKTWFGEALLFGLGSLVIHLIGVITIKVIEKKYKVQLFK